MNKQHNKQNSKLIINMTTKLKAKLQFRADEVGVSLNSYCVMLLTTVRPKIQTVDFKLNSTGG